MSDSQERTLDIAYFQGLSINYNETLQAIALQESSAGNDKYGDTGFASKYNRSYGSYGMKCSTATYILDRVIGINPFTDDEIIDNLVHNEYFAAKLAVEYFEYLLKRFSHTMTPWSHAVMAYNVGEGNLRRRGIKFYMSIPRNYLKLIKHRIVTEVRPYNNRGER
jgi:hypothetical protein